MSTDLQDKNGRIFWRNAQILASRDLRGGLDDDARRRRLHNRDVHGTWGVAIGFGAALQADQRTVLVAPGYVIDSLGRDLLCPQTLLVPPPSDGVFILAAIYDASISCRPAPEDADACGGADPRRERALIQWIAAAEFQNGLQVPLARAQFASGQVAGDLDLNVRHYARRLIRPHIGTGVTTAGATNWEDISAPKVLDLWLQAVVDTTAAGFLGTPSYLVRLVRALAARKFPRDGSLDQSAAAFASKPATSLDGIGFVTQARPDQFTFRIPRGSLPFGVDLTASEAETSGWVISWAGFEAVDTPPQQFHLIDTFFALGANL